MKLKYNFVVRQVGDSYVAVAVGDGAVKFNGMIKLNATGVTIFSMLKENVEKSEVVAAVVEKYGIDSELAERDVSRYLENLKSAELIDG